MSPARRRPPMDTAANTRGVMKSTTSRAAGRTIKVLLMSMFALATIGMHVGLGEAGTILAGAFWAVFLLGGYMRGKW